MFIDGDLVLETDFIRSTHKKAAAGQKGQANITAALTAAIVHDSPHVMAGGAGRM